MAKSLKNRITDVIRALWNKRELITCLFLLVLIIIPVISQIVLILLQDNPNEFREMTMVKYAIDFSNGINPYAMKTLDSEIPPNAGIYGFLMPLLCSPFLIFINEAYALKTMEILTILVACIGLYFTYKTYACIYGKEYRRYIALLTAIIMFRCYYSYDYPYIFAASGSWGVTTLIIVLYLVTADNAKQKCRPLLYATLIVLAFYIKQYYIFIGLPIFLYLLVKSRKEAVKFAVSGILVGGVSLLIIRIIFPLYFTLTIGRAENDANLLFGNWERSLEQFRASANDIIVMVIILGIMLFLVIEKLLCSLDKKNALLSISSSISVYEIASIIFIPVILYLSRNNGQYAEYFIQVWNPVVILYGAISINKIIELFDSGSDSLRHLTYWTIGIAISLTVLNSAQYEFKNPFCEELKQSRYDWNKAYEILNNYGEDGLILVTPHLTQYCIEHNIVTDDYGQMEFFSQTPRENFQNNDLMKKLFPELMQLFDNVLAYNELVEDRVNDGKYSVIAITEQCGLHNMKTLRIDKAIYKELDVITLCTGQQVWKTHFYVRQDLV